MPKSKQQIALSRSRNIPFDRLVLSQANVRRVKAGVDIEELAADIARRTLIQSLSVRPVLDEAGEETGMFEVPAGGRRFRALELLVKQKRLAKDAPIPCVIRTDGIAEEDSLAENVQRAPLHPLDQFRAFQAMRERGLSEQAIAAAFFVTPAVVKQRLRLASVSPHLLDHYAEDAMTLDQLMAFTVVCDHARQEQVWEALQRSYTREPHAIRRMLTEGAVRATDKRALFVGIETYAEAGGIVLRDLFQPDDGGWLQDAALLDLMVSEKLREEVAAIEAEGWRWVEVAADMTYGRHYGLRHLRGERRELTNAELARRDELIDQLAAIEAEHMDEDLPEDVAAQYDALREELEGLDNPPVTWRAEDMAIAGVLVTIDGGGRLRVDRGYVRPEDEPVVEPEPMPVDEEPDGPDQPERTTDAPFPPPAEEPDEDEGLRPIPDRLLAELTAVRTLALRLAVGADPEVAFNTALHALCLRVFYRYVQDSCLELEMKSAVLNAPGLTDGAVAAAIHARHRDFADRLPDDPAELWDCLVGFDRHIRDALFAHCVAQGLNAVAEQWNPRPKALAHAGRLATAVSLDMAVHWEPTIETYLGRVTKARILQAVRETCGEREADRIADLKKGDMAARAADLLAGSGWLPEPLRTAGVYPDPRAVDEAIEPTGEQSEAVADEQAVGPDASFYDTVENPADAIAEAAE
jgi:ParB family chromosome partitioning protein